VPAWLHDLTLRAMSADPPHFGQRAWRGVLAVVSLAYGAAIRTRNAGFNLGLLPAQRLPCRVVCVGNLTVGGTGKTPAVIALARRLTEAGSKLCVVLRGYGRSGPAVGVVSDGRDLLLTWQHAGEEAVLLARHLPGVPILVGGDRLQVGRLALQRFGPDTILLDDGFQHRRLHRDVDLVLLDATDPFGGGWLLPRGRLREPVTGLARAHAVVVTRSDQAADLESLRQSLRATAPEIPIAWAVHRPSRVVDLASGEERSVEVLRGARVFAVSGIANPRSFHQTVTDLGATIAGALVFPDHHAFLTQDRAHMAREARAAGATHILTTEKDAIRLGTNLPAGLPVCALSIDLEVVEGAEVLHRLLGVSLGGAGRG
jgi:tetraacyldisaccharide 4'-kinase